jgi:hypothetical protein
MDSTTATDAILQRLNRSEDNMSFLENLQEDN